MKARKARFVKELRGITGCSMYHCNKAFHYFGYNMDACIEWLELMTLAVCRRNKDGSLMTEKDKVAKVRQKYNL